MLINGKIESFEIVDNYVHIVLSDSSEKNILLNSCYQVTDGIHKYFIDYMHGSLFSMNELIAPIYVHKCIIENNIMYVVGGYTILIFTENDSDVIMTNGLSKDSIMYSMKRPVNKCRYKISDDNIEKLYNMITIKNLHNSIYD